MLKHKHVLKLQQIHILKEFLQKRNDPHSLSKYLMASKAATDEQQL